MAARESCESRVRVAGAWGPRRWRLVKQWCEARRVRRVSVVGVAGEGDVVVVGMWRQRR
jgi:hypothetical protein